MNYQTIAGQTTALQHRGHMKITMTFSAACFAIAGAADASAEIEQIDQRFILSESLIPPLSAVDLFANMDLSTITGAGSVTAVITGASVRIFTRSDTSSPFELIDARDLIMPSDPYADLPLNMRAEFVNGVFTDIVRIISDTSNHATDYLSIRENKAGGFFNVDANQVMSAQPSSQSMTTRR